MAGASHVGELDAETTAVIADAVLAGVHAAFVSMDEAGDVLIWNRAAETLFGWTSEEARGRPLLDLLIPERLRESHREGLAHFLRTGEGPVLGRQIELPALCRDGSERTVELTVSANRRAERWVFTAFLRDVEERRAAAAAQARLAAIVETSTDAIFSVDEAGIIQTWNGGAETTFGYPAADAIGRRVLMLVPDDLAEQGRSLVERVLGGTRVKDLETVRLHQDGRRVPIALSLSPLSDATGNVTGWSTIARDITERRRAQERAAWLTHHDEVTGLPNRASFLAEAEGGAVVVLDADDFRSLSDTLSTEVAGHVVRALAERVTEQADGQAVACLGGAMFAVAVEAHDAEAVARRFRGAVAGPVALSGLTLFVDVSAGVCALGEDGGVEPALGAAVAAVRRAQTRRTEVEVHQGRPDENRSLTVLAEFADALKAGEVEFHYQPKVDLRTGAAVGVEALVRWRRDGVPVSPGAFLPAVEGSSLVRPLATAAIDSALGASAEWRRAGLELSVAVNLSPLNLLDLGIAHEIAALLAQHSLRSGSLVLEVTEGAVMQDPFRAASVLSGLRAMGTSLSVDDFGTGYSSLAYLQRLPLDELKLDRAFISDLGTKAEGSPIVESTVGLAHSLGLRVVGEGVEDQATLDALAAMGCEQAQGYFLGRPMPADALLEWALARG